MILKGHKHLSKISAGFPDTRLSYARAAMPSAAIHRAVKRSLFCGPASDKNYRWMWLRPLRKHKCADQGYVAARKVYSSLVPRFSEGFSTNPR